MAKSFTFYADPGHAWLAVEIADSIAVGLRCNAYSEYSYIRGSTLYLEEDCDASKFIAAYTLAHDGVAPTITEQHTNSESFIRRLSRINR